jgi:hypothetical protein
MVARTTSGGWIISHRCSWITVYVLYCNAQVNLIVILMTFVSYLYSISCPIVICLTSMLLFINCPFFYIAITIYYLLVLFTFLQTTIFYHSIRSILYLQQTGEIDNLTVSWDKVLGCVVCRFHVAAGAKLHPGQVFWCHCPELSQS